MSKKQYIYEEIRDFIKKRIETGAYDIGHKIPSEQEFSKVFGVHRKTIRTAISMLVEEGMLKTLPGKGTYVIDLEEEIPLIERYRLDERTKESGTVEILHANIRQIGNYYEHVFKCSQNEKMYSIDFLRKSGEQPLILEQVFIPVKYIKNLEQYDLKAFDIEDVFKFEGIEIKKVHQKLNVIDISTRNSKILKIENNKQVLLLEKYSYDAEENCIEYKKQYIRGNLVKITNTFGKVGDV